MRNALLKSICTITMGQAPPGSSYNENNEGLPLIAGAGDFGNIFPNPNRFTTEGSKISQRNDIILCIRATIGDLNLSDRQYCLGRGVVGLRPFHEKLNQRYLWHWLGTMKHCLRGRARGSTFKQVNKETIENMTIPLPPLEEQKRIAAILDKADAVRRKRKESIRLTEEFLKSVFLDMFGDPVTNPKGWEISPFENQLISIRYGTGSPPPYIENGIPFIRATNIKKGTILDKSMRYISQKDAQRISKCKVKSGDLIIVRSGVNAGDCGFVPRKYDCAYAAYDMIMKLDYEKAIFYNDLINSGFGKAMIAPLKRRAGQPHLNASQVRSLELYSPPLERMNRYANIREQVLASSVNMQKAERTYSLLFNSLIQQAFIGEL